MLVRAVLLVAVVALAHGTEEATLSSVDDEPMRVSAHEVMDVDAAGHSEKQVEALLDAQTDSQGRLLDDFNIRLGDTSEAAIPKKPCPKNAKEQKKVNKAMDKLARKNDKANRKAAKAEAKVRRQANRAAKKVMDKAKDKPRTEKEKKIETAEKKAVKLRKNMKKV